MCSLETDREEEEEEEKATPCPLGNDHATIRSLLVLAPSEILGMHAYVPSISFKDSNQAVSHV